MLRSVRLSLANPTRARRIRYERSVNLSIIIVNWKSKDCLRKCLRTIQTTCRGLSPEIIVVDNGSYDGCGTMLAEEFPNVIFVQSERNIGFARANNLGFERASGEAVWFLNPDTEVLEGAGAALLHYLETLPDAGILGAKLLNTDGSLQTSCVQTLPTALNQTLDCELLRQLFPHSFLWGISPLWSTREPVEVEAVCGASLVLQSNVFRQIGCFSEQYFMYGEDMDLCLRVRNANCKVYYVPEARVVHHGGGSSKSESNRFSDVLMRESVYRFLKVNRGQWSAASYRVSLTVAALLRLAMLLPVRVARGVTWRAPLQKWTSILRWSIGLEPRASRLSLNQGVFVPSASCHRPAVAEDRGVTVNPR